MPRRLAIDIALDAAAQPAKLSLLAVGPLPEGLKDLLRIVADGEWRSATTEEAYRGHSAEEIRAASASFLKVVLFEKVSSPHRVLGLSPGATEDEVRENKRLLLKWLHPDRNAQAEERALLSRVIEAAEAIEEGRGTSSAASYGVQPRKAPAAQPGSNTRRPPQAAAQRPRVKPSGAPVRTRPTGQRRYVLARGLGLLGRMTKLTALTAVIAVGGLVVWRMTMHEPIGVSLARYSKMALGAVSW